MPLEAPSPSNTRDGHAAVMWDPASLRYRFGPDHPFDPRRLELTIDLFHACGLLGHDAGAMADTADASQDAPLLVRPRPATEAELRLAHDPEYIATVTRLSLPDAVCDDERWGLGTSDVPIFPGMHDAAALTAGGSIRAAELIMHGAYRHVFHLAGGHHHAQRALASGFCIYNDATIAIEWLTSEHQARVLYIDNDAHHGDGVEFAFADRDDVLTVSLHESGRSLYPGTGFVTDIGLGRGRGYSVNVPLEAGTDDASWLSLFEASVPALAVAFRPDIIVLQSGCDGHARDPLTHLRATTRTFETVARRIHALAHDLCDGRLIVLGGGGYDIWSVVPRAWTLVWCAISDQEAPVEVPFPWRERWQPASPIALPRHMRDDPTDYPPLANQDQIRAVNAATLRHLRERAWWVADARRHSGPDGLG